MQKETWVPISFSGCWSVSLLAYFLHLQDAAHFLPAALAREMAAGVIAVGGEAGVVLCSSGSNDGAATHTDL